MNLLPRLLLLAFLGSASLLPQVAQLGVKGRTREAGQPSSSPTTANPTHRLPRRIAIEDLVIPPNEQEIERERMRAALPAPRLIPEDRVRPLVRRSPAAVPALPLPAAAAALRDPRPRRLPGDGSLAGLVPSFEIPPDSEARAEDLVPNRWKFRFPSWRRYEDSGIDAVYSNPRLLDPFNKNKLKGDMPVFGKHGFLILAGSSDTLIDARRVPTTNAVSTANPDSFNFFGDGEQAFIRQSVRLSIELFRGSAGFKPVDFSLKITPEFNINYLRVRENNVVGIDPRQGTTRLDSFVGLQEMFFETRFGTNSSKLFRRGRRDFDDRGDAEYDFSALRVGIQRFTSDFRGFIFSDEQPAARLFGTFRNNAVQYNLAYFNMLEKDTNSGLNRWRMRNQSVYIANLYVQDFPSLGYNVNFSLHYNNDQPSFHIDNNGFLVRPAPLGDPRPHKVRAGYAGFAGDGRIGRYNVSHALYYAFGRDDFNPIPARNNAQHIGALMGALELAYEVDWRKYRVSYFYASGDRDINDGRATGFDAIVDNPQFGGGGFLGNPALADRGLLNPLFEGGGTNLLNRQTIPLTAVGVALFSFNSLLPSLRSNKLQGQANFINPGIMLFNGGLDAKLTPKLKAQLNVNYLRFDRTEVLQAILFQSGIKHSIGVDAGVGLQYRPFLSENIVLTGGFGVLVPGAGFKQIYTSQSLLSAFINTRFFF
jgi:hypothetical protein